MAIAGAGSAWLIPRFGWQGVFVAGAAGPMVLAVLLIAFLPESVQFLVLRNRNDVRVVRILSRLSPAANLSGSSFTLVGEQSRDAGRKRRHVLSRVYRRGTLLLWAIYFMHLVVYYLLAGWLPTLFRDAGFGLQSASLISSIFPVGGVLGTVIIGYLMDRTNARRLVGWVYLSVAVLAVVVGQALRLPYVLCALMFLIGALLTGGGISLSTIAAQYYGAACRGTGVSWMYAVGRLGGVCGMLAGATLTGMGWKFGSVFALLGVPSVIAGGGLLLLAKLASKMDDAPQIRQFAVGGEPKTD
jgi:MFS transporter, AAHS family, 4-hydroxybenzoate transporter